MVSRSLYKSVNRYLSLLGNPLCPALLQDFNEDFHRDYRWCDTANEVASRHVSSTPIDYNVNTLYFSRLSIISRMLKLKFLDAKQVDKTELLSSLQCLSTHNANGLVSEQQTSTEQSEARMEKFGTLKKFFGFAPREMPTVTVSRSSFSPLPPDNLDNSQTSQKSIYGRVKSHYEGSQSQGNRFILNQDL